MHYETESLCVEWQPEIERLIGHVSNTGRARLLKFDVKKKKRLNIGKIQSYAGVIILYDGQIEVVEHSKYIGSLKFTYGKYNIHQIPNWSPIQEWPMCFRSGEIEQ